MNGQDVSSPDDYVFDSQTGVLTIKNDGFWQVLYQDSSWFGDPNADPVDIPGVSSAYVHGQGGDFVSLDLRGRSVLGTISINDVNANDSRTFR
ncbi:MAG: hypothetical protein KKB50_04315, partial [Planctomycetes bacterium]|nr:hypothetical protein [Planctomycetota bacterium]